MTGLVAMNTGAMFFTMALRPNIVCAVGRGNPADLRLVLMRGRRGSAGMGGFEAVMLTIQPAEGS